MNLGQTILKMLQPKSERERMEFRACMARALAEAEDLHITLNGHITGLHGIDVENEKEEP